MIGWTFLLAFVVVTVVSVVVVEFHRETKTLGFAYCQEERRGPTKLLSV